MARKIREHSRSSLVLGTMLMASLVLVQAGVRSQTPDFTSSGWITTWLVLGPYSNPGRDNPGPALLLDYLTDGAQVFEANFYPRDGDEVSSDCAASNGGIPGPGCYQPPVGSPLITPTVELVDVNAVNPTLGSSAVTNVDGGNGETDTVNLNMYYGGAKSGAPDAVMAYAVTYVNNTSGKDLPVIGQCASDDSIQVLIGGQTVHANSIPRYEGASGTVQDQFEGVLRKGVNRLLVKVFEGGGDWAFRLRFLNGETCEVLQEPDIHIETEPPADVPNVVVVRDFPDVIGASDTVTVSLALKVFSGTPGAAVIREKLPLTYPYVAGSASDGGSFAGDTITWNVPGPLAGRTLTYQVRTPDPVTLAVFYGTYEIGGLVSNVSGELGPPQGDPGWIKDWLILDAICQTDGCPFNDCTDLPAAQLILDWISDGQLVTEQTVLPVEGLQLSPEFKGASAGKGFASGNGTGTFQALHDDDGCIDLNALFNPNDQTMAVSAVYVENPTGQDLSLFMGVGFEDVIKVLLNGKKVYVNDVPRGFCRGAPPTGPQETFPLTLRPGKNLLLVEVWTGCGTWNFGARFQDAAGATIVLPVSLEPDGYEPTQKVVRIERDIPDNLQNGGSGRAELRVTPVLDAGAVVIDEVLPAGLSGSDPDQGGQVNGGTIHWDLGVVDSALVLHYTLSVGEDAVDGVLASRATLDGKPVDFTGDLSYTGSPLTARGFIKMWNHLGPLGGGACDVLAGVNPPPDLTVLDWIVNEDESITELDNPGSPTPTAIHPFPGLITRPDYGGTGVVPGGGARATGLETGPGAQGVGGPVDPERYPIWKGTIAPTGTIDHAMPWVNGFDAENHVTMSCVYVTNKTGSDINTLIGIGSDDALQIILNNESVGLFAICRGYGAEDEEQNTARVTLKKGENRLLVKVSDGCCPSGFRLRFHAPGAGGGAGCGASSAGLLPPAISLSLVSKDSPPPGQVVRKLSKPSYGAGEAVQVTLAATAPQAGSITVHEELPAGADAAGISAPGARVGNAIDWAKVAVGPAPTSLTYQLTPSPCSGDLAFGQASTLKVGSVEALIGGDSTLTRVFRDDPLGLWTSQTIGTTGGSAQRLGSHEAFLQGPGAGIKNQKDEFHFISVPQNGDFELSARMDCLDTTGGPGGQGGLMVRDSAEPNAATVFFFVLDTAPPLPRTGVAQIRARMRRDTDKFAADITLGGGDLTKADVLAFPVYLKLKRVSTPTPQIQLFRSADGLDYGQPLGTRNIGIGTSDVNLKADTLIGLAASGNGGSVRFAAREVSGPVLGSPPPEPPQNLTAQGSKQKVVLSWEPPAAGTPPTSYTIHRGGQGGPYSAIAEVLAPARTYTDTSGLADNTRYCYVVKSKGPGGESGPSGEACAVTTTGVPFKRGDADGDGAINLTDPIYTLANQFQGGPAPPCMDAADADDQGDYNLTDAIFSLQWQFLAGKEPPAPGPFRCDVDPTGDDPFVDCTYKNCAP